MAVAFALVLATVNGHAQEAPKTPLGQNMDAMNVAFRAFGPLVADPAKNDCASKLVAIIAENHTVYRIRPAGGGRGGPGSKS